MLHFNAFLFGCGHHSAAWRHPDSPVERLGEITYYEDLARTAERGCLDAVFFADGHSVLDPASGSWWFLEPLTALSAMARATWSIQSVPACPVCPSQSRRKLRWRRARNVSLVRFEKNGILRG